MLRPHQLAVRSSLSPSPLPSPLLSPSPPPSALLRLIVFRRRQQHGQRQGRSYSYSRATPLRARKNVSLRSLSLTLSSPSSSSSSSSSPLATRTRRSAPSSRRQFQTSSHQQCAACDIKSTSQSGVRRLQTGAALSTSPQAPSQQDTRSNDAASPSADQPPVPAADHRALASALDLFSTTPFSPGTPLLHADGSHVFLRLQQFLRAQYSAFGFREVISPTIYKQALWERSGHWENYKDDMFQVRGGQAEAEADAADEVYGLKPMNCPGHCLLFKSRSRSWRDLPIRYADFSPLHRNEISGALSGLTRVRRFHQDDGHIFCRLEQVGGEIEKTLRLVGLVYEAFGLGPYKLVLSTRPEGYIGEIAQWNQAESQLKEALDATGRAWEMNDGDGAFYGPKIDIILRDSDGKEHQTATIQLDFQLPARFELEYDGPDGTPVRPVMIHRAVFGSLERFMALLIEHYAGRWPFWLSPRQLAILTVNDTEEVASYAQQISAELNGFNSREQENDGTYALQPLNREQFQISVDGKAATVPAKVAQARADHYNLIAVIGKREAQNGTVTVDLTGQPRIDQVLALPEFKDLGFKDLKAVKMTPTTLKRLMQALMADYL